MSIIVAILLSVAGTYAALLLALYFGQGNLLYLPMRELAASPADARLAYEEVHLTSADGVRLHGWFVPAAEPRAPLLFFHGNAGNISHRLDSLRIFHDLGLSVLIFDYRGYGRSEGSPSEEGTRQDALAAWQHLVETRGVAPQRIVLFGRSLGAALAAWLAGQVQPGALILESAFTSLPDLAGDLYWWLPGRRLARFEYATRDYLAKVGRPVLVVHSPDDEIIPFRHGQALYQAAPSPKEFLELHGDHNAGFLLSGEHYVDGLDGFLTRHLPTP